MEEEITRVYLYTFAVVTRWLIRNLQEIRTESGWSRTDNFSDAFASGESLLDCSDERANRRELRARERIIELVVRLQFNRQMGEAPGQALNLRWCQDSRNLLLPIYRTARCSAYFPARVYHRSPRLVYNCRLRRDKINSRDSRTFEIAPRASHHSLISVM
jgi:hypothetical protein